MRHAGDVLEIDAGYTPVVAPSTADAEGEGLLNTNADTVGSDRRRRHVGRLRDGTGLTLLREAGRAARRERRRQRDCRNRAGSLRRAPDPGHRRRRHATQAGERLSGDRQRRALGRDLLGRPDRVAGLRGNDAAEVSSRVAWV